MYHITPDYTDRFYGEKKKRQSKDSDGDAVLDKVIGEGLSAEVMGGGSHVEVWNIPGKRIAEK